MPSLAVSEDQIEQIAILAVINPKEVNSPPLADYRSQEVLISRGFADGHGEEIS